MPCSVATKTWWGPSYEINNGISSCVWVKYLLICFLAVSKKNCNCNMSIILNHKSNQSLQQCILTFFSLIPMHPNIFLIYCWYVKYLRTYAGSFNLQKKNIYYHSGIHKLPKWRNIHQILVNWKNRMKGIRCYMTAIINKAEKEKHKKLRYVGN